MANQITHVISFTWEALYVNEKLIWEGEVAYMENVMPILLHQVFDRYETVCANEEWAEQLERVPLSLDAVVLDM